MLEKPSLASAGASALAAPSSGVYAGALAVTLTYDVRRVAKLSRGVYDRLSTWTVRLRLRELKGQSTKRNQ